MTGLWVAFFSQTGGEIADIAEKLGRWPDLIITNQRPAHLRTIDSRVVENGFETVSNKPTLEELSDQLGRFVPRATTITLHGWLRIMPPELCKRYKIVNGHPGLITLFPELKGKDPQIRAYEGIHNGKYNVAGTVIHEVTQGVDEGKVLLESEIWVDSKLSLSYFFLILKEKSIHLWLEYLRKVL